MPKLNNLHRSRWADGGLAAFNAGELRLYTGSMPAANTSPTGTLLLAITLPNPAFGAASSGAAAKAGTWQGTGAASGDAGYAALINGAANEWIYLTVSGTGGSGEVQIEDADEDPTIEIIQNGVVTVTAATITMPAE